MGWWDASDSSTLFTDTGCSTAATSDGDSIGCWQDKSGNSRHMTASGSEQPTLKLNEDYGLSILSFSGDDELDAAVTSAMSSGNQHHTIFVVLKNTKDDGDNNTFFKYGTVASSGQQSRLDYRHSDGDLRHSWYGGNRIFGEQEERTLGHTTRISFVYSGGGSFHNGT